MHFDCLIWHGQRTKEFYGKNTFKLQEIQAIPIQQYLLKQWSCTGGYILFEVKFLIRKILS